MSTDPAHHAEYNRINEGLRAQAQRLAQADVIRVAAKRETAALLHAADQLAAVWGGFAVSDEDAAGFTGLPVEAFTLARATGLPAGPDSGQWSQMTDADLAAAVIGYDYGHSLAVAELHTRFPHVGALPAAAAVLTRQHEDALPPRSPTEWLDGPPAPGVRELIALYRAHVEAIAVGRPVLRVQQPGRAGLPPRSARI